MLYLSIKPNILIKSNSPAKYIATKPSHALPEVENVCLHEKLTLNNPCIVTTNYKYRHKDAGKSGVVLHASAK